MSWSEVPLTRREKSLNGAIGALGVGGGIAAVFRTENEVGSATLLAVGAYFVVAAILGRFPRLIIGGNEVDPRRLEEVKEESDDAKDNSEDAIEGLANTRDRIAALETAMADLSARPIRREPEVASSTVPLPQASEAAQLDDRLVRLAQEYNEVRWTMSSGDQRTIRMTGIVDSMIAVSRESDVPNVEALLASEDRGLRLAGVAYLNARPDPAFVAALARIGLTDDKPFNEYWGLLTLRKVLKGGCDHLDANLRRQLQERLRVLTPGSDRAREIQGILRDCP